MGAGELMRLLQAGLTAALVAAALPAQAIGWLRPLVDTRPDGATVIVDPTPSSLAALRIVLLGGAGADPVGKAGLAALTAQMVSTGTAASGASLLGGQFARLGGTFEVRTLVDATVIAIEAPAATFDEAARIAFAALGSPVITEERVEVERRVLMRAPFVVDGRRWHDVVPTLLYPFPIRGTERSLRSLDGLAVLEHYRQRYRASETIVIATGAVSRSSLRRVLDQSFVLPSAYGEKIPAASAGTPKLPAKLSEAASVRQLVMGYAACPPRSDSAGSCRVLAALLRSWLAEALAREAPASGARGDVAYVPTAHHGFLLARVTAGQWKGVVGAVNAAFARAERKPSRRDLATAVATLGAEASWRRAHPDALADRYAQLVVAGRRTAGNLVAVRSEVEAVDPAAIVELSKTTIVPEKLISVRMTPLR